jgi:hypothetical protein
VHLIFPIGVGPIPAHFAITARFSWSLWWIGLPPVDPKDIEAAREALRRKAEREPLSVRAGHLVGRGLRLFQQGH